jgi:hypothetical protein
MNSRSISRNRAHSRVRVLVLVLGCSGLTLWPQTAAAHAAETQAAAARAAERIKVTISRSTISVNNATNDGNVWSVTVSGTSSKHASLAVYMQFNSHAACRSTAAAESTIGTGAAGSPSAYPQTASSGKFPLAPNDFTGSFNWLSNTYSLTLHAEHAGRGFVCAYLSPPTASQGVASTAKPYATRSLSVKFVKGPVPPAVTNKT